MSKLSEFTNQVKNANYSDTMAAMETGDHLKNGASQKNYTIKGNLKITTILWMILLILYGCDSADDSLIPVKINGKWGYINFKGEYVINPQFDYADPFSEGLAKIQISDGKIGYIDNAGKYVISANYIQGTAFCEGLAFVVSEGGYPTCIDKNGNTQFVLKDAEVVGAFSEGLAIFMNMDNKIGFVDKTGKIIINAQFNDGNNFKSNFASIEMDKKWGFIDKKGTYVINPQFDYADTFSEGLASVKQGNKWGYIDIKGVYTINPQFDYTYDFNEGLACVKQGNSWGYINNKGKFEINPQFDEAYSFSNGLALVKQGNTFGYINKQGKFEINPQFSDARNFKGNYALVRSADKWGLIDKKGQYVINPQFDGVNIKFSEEKVINDFYDASEFVKLFFEKDEGNSFDGINSSTNLRNLSNNYSDLKTSNNATVYSEKYIKVTKDIYIYSIVFKFLLPIYEDVANYDYWGYKTGSKRVYDYDAKPFIIQYRFIFNEKAEGKGRAIANAMKTEIERRHQLTMKSKNGYSGDTDPLFGHTDPLWVFFQRTKKN